MDTFSQPGKKRKVGGKRGYLVTPCEEQKRSHKPSLIRLTFATSSPAILGIRSYPIEIYLTCHRERGGRIRILLVFTYEFSFDSPI